MGYDKAVDSAKLDACCTAEANAIRVKTGSSEGIEYDYENNRGFADTISQIHSVDEIINRTLVSFTSMATSINAPHLLANQTNLVEIIIPECTAIATAISGSTNVAQSFAQNCTSLERIYAPKLTDIKAAQSCFQGCSSLEKVVFPSLTYCFQSNMFNGCTSLTHWDSGNYSNTTTSSIFGQYHFHHCTSLSVIIIRNNSVKSINNLNAFTDTKFDSGGAGGTIYVPQEQIDNYKAATNWSTLDSYGTITWIAIEGSQYENYYADGTPIPTA